ncbi:uncharacterized protein LOC113136395 isoform X2 [Mastacembelus armatus]|nr:uncharacterized protein LOC113136395 isoform X2 [Mastacembelus armatus]XP_026172966.1 uncharacterized protein LOC113136395 isoform X2 [Mastacembelus armatus]
MAPKGGTVFFLLIVASSTIANPLEMMPYFRCVAKTLMMQCQNKGYQVPNMMLLNTVFNNSDLPKEDRNAHPSNTLLSTFLDVLNVVAADTKIGSLNTVPMDDSNKMPNKMRNCTNLPNIIRIMRNSSDSSACYMKAFVAPLSWTILTTQGENNIASDDYDMLLWAARPALQEMPSSRVALPTRVESQHLKKMMMLLQEMYESLPENQRTHVVNWAKEQISQNYFNCTTRPSSDSNSKHMELCKPSLQWLNLDALTMMGPYLSHLTSEDIDSCPKEKLCEFFRSEQFKSTLSRATNINPTLGKKFLQRIQECFNGKNEFAEHVVKLGALACYYYDAPDLNPDLSKKFLSQLDNCKPNPTITQLKKHLINSVISKFNATQALRDIGSSVTLFSPKQLSMIPGTDLKEVLTNLGPNIKWTQSQLQTLVKNQLGDKMCKEISAKELMALQSVAEGLPSCVLKFVKARDIMNDTEALKNISMQMRMGQLKAMLQGLCRDAGPSELVQKLDGPLLHSISLTNLEKADITSLNQVENKTWSRPQAAYLAKRMQDLKQLQFRRLHSVLQGLTCTMIDNVTGSDTLNMAQAITETPQWLSKFQAGCVAQKLFATLEKERADYFKTITEEELYKIPTLLLLHLPPLKVKDLPDSVCPVYLYKMEKANLSLLPLSSPSRPALTQRALSYLTTGTELSKLTFENVSMLGPLLCELPPSQLKLMAPNVLNASLQAMASCKHIPQHHRTELLQLVTQIFGDPAWSPEAMEAVGPLLLLDDNATSALPNKPWMKDILYSLKSHIPSVSDTLKKKLFDLTISTSNTARKKREADSNSVSDKSITDVDRNTNSGSINAEAPTSIVIEKLGSDNIHWTAAQLDMMTNDTFVATVGTLGSVPGYNADQLAVLSKKAIQAFGPVSKMTETVVMQIGCITQGFSNSDLETLPLSLDTVIEISKCHWNESKIRPVWKAVAKYNNLTAQHLGAAEIADLGQIFCGLNSSEIEQLNTTTLREAVGSLNGIKCSFYSTRQWRNLIVSMFGNCTTWRESLLSDLGMIITGLDASDWSSIEPSVLPFLDARCIPHIPLASFAALSVAQLNGLGPDNAAMVTAQQQAVLTKEQQAALDRAASGTTETAQSASQSGAPSFSVKGILNLMKPFPFLLMGFLLL